MPASVISDGSSASGKKGCATATNSRQERALVKALASSLKSSDTTQQDSDLRYIIDSVEGPDRDLVPTIARLLRSGGIRRAQSSIDPETNNKGRELPPSVTHFRKSIGSALLSELLQSSEPKVFTDDVLAANKLSTDEMCRLVCFALNIREGEKLPSISPLLRFSTILVQFCTIRYGAVGRRLQTWTPGSSWGFFGRSSSDPKKVELLVRDGAPALADSNPFVIVAALAQGSDWKIISNHALDSATLVSEDEDMKIVLANRFKKAGIRLPATCSLEWAIPFEEWPEAMKKRTIGESEEECAATPTPKKPRGSGAARPRTT